MKDILNIFKELWEFLYFLGPTQSFFLIIGSVFIVYIGVYMCCMSTGNPKYYSDEYVKTHMHVFHDWFLRHPEDKARYE